MTGVRGAVLEPSAVARGEASSRTEVGRLRDQRAGRRRHLRRHRRQPRPGPPELARPARPGAAAAALRRARRTSTAACSRRPRRPAPAWSTSDRMWHYTEGIANHSPVWAQHGIRILPGPSSLWFDATGQAAAGAAVPRLRHAGHARAHRADRPRAHLVRRHAQDRREGVRALGLRAEPRPHRQGHEAAAQPGPGRGGRARCRRSSTAARTSSSPTTLPELVAGMNRITGGTPSWTSPQIEREVVARDREIEHPFTKDLQITAIRGRPQLPRRQADPGRAAAPAARPRGRPADRRPAQPAHPQDARRAGDRPVRPGAAPGRRGRSPGCTRPARSPASAAAACTATARWRARSSAAACSPGGRRAARVAAAL